MNRLKRILQNENSAIVIKNFLFSCLVKGGSLIVSLMTLPIFIHFFQDKKILGVWYTVLSVITWILNFDLGVGNGLRNHLVKAIGEKNQADIRKYISSAYFIIGVIVLLFAVVFYFALPYVSWNAVFNISPDLVSGDVLLTMTRCVVTGILLQFFLRLITSVLYALQLSSVTGLLMLVTSTLQLLYVLIIPSGTMEQNLIAMSYGYVFCANAPLLITTIVVFATKLRGAFPHIKYFDKKYAKAVLSLGGIFFFCQIMYMIIANTNEFFMTQYAGPESVVEYQVYHKIFGLAGTVFNLALAPVWSAITKAIAEKDFDWVKKLYSTLKKASLLVVIAEFLVVFVLQFVFDLWLGAESFPVNYIYAFSSAAFGAVFTYQAVLSTIVCGMGKMKLQAICYGVGNVVKVLFIHFVSQIYPSWVVVVWANVLILASYCILQQIDLNKYIKRNLVK